MSAYDPNDFQANPGKYRHYRTAIVPRLVVTHNGEHDIPAGKVVGITYHGTAFNRLYRRTEPIYVVRSSPGSEVAMYASSLGDFVL